MDPAELALFDETVSALAASADEAELTKALDEFGWQDVLRTYLGASVRAVFTAQGRAGTWSSALHDVLAVSLAQLADGALQMETTAVVLPRPRSATPARGEGPDAQIDGILLGARATTQSLLAATVDRGGALVLLRMPITAVSLESAGGLDPCVDIRRVRANGIGAVVAEGDDAASWWTNSVALARRALSHQLCGVLTTMLDLARLHAVERSQFGRPIGTFQAVRHKLAESHVAITGATALADAAWESPDEVLASTTAKLAASHAFAVVAAHTQQVLAGVGFTAEHPYHRAMKRAVLIDRLFGSGDDLAPLVGRELAARKCAPRLVEL
jgi:hypothetical protein